MIVKGIVEEDFVNYKLPSTVILMPYCNWKCGLKECHNAPFALAPEIDLSPQDIIDRYLNNPITKALVFSGLEPFMSFDDMVVLIEKLRKYVDDTVVIYTGYNKEEVGEQVEFLQKNFDNIIIKFGRYLSGKPSRWDELLGVTLISDNQYAERIS